MLCTQEVMTLTIFNLTLAFSSKAFDQQLLLFIIGKSLAKLKECYDNLGV